MDSLGIFTACLIGTTPPPTDKYGRLRKDFTKISLGAESTVQTFYFAAIQEFLTALAPFNYTLIAIEQADTSIDYKSYQAPHNTAIILGAEVDGVSKEFLHASHVILELPQRGEKESLNVSVAGAIVLYRLFDI